MKKVKIVVRRQRYRCKDCDYTYLLPIGNMHEDRFMTKRLVAYIRNAALKETFTSIAELIGTSEATVRDVFRDYIAGLEHGYEPQTPEWLGIDEVYLGKQMRCVFTNILERHPIEMLPVRDKVAVEVFLRKLERDKVQGVVMDMWNPYKQAVKEVLPHAIIVVDKFHIVRMANIAMEKIRKKTREDMPARWRVKLKNDRKILLKRNETLTINQKFILDTWLLNYEGLGKAYAAKEAFINIWNSGDRVEAEYLYSKWKDSLDEEIAPAFAELTRAMENWHDEIFTYFDYRYTNAYTESANAIIKQIQHAGRGYSFDVIRAKIMFGMKPKEEKKYLTEEDFV
jgi:transposase